MNARHAEVATYVYGAGRMGREVLGHFRALGLEPRAFIDRAARPGATVDGLAVIPPDEAIAAGDDAQVVVALHSPGADVAAVVDALGPHRFADVRTLFAECRQSGWLPRSPFWLDPRFDWAAADDAIARARSLLSDPASVRTFDQQVALRRFGDYAGLDAPTPDDQYLPHGLARWREPMRLVDCGAYDGDTIRALRAGGYAVDAFVALEPDADNFARLVERHGDDVGRLLQVGAFSTNGVLAFSAGEGGAAHLDADGTTTIDVVRLDDLCDAFSPTLIKMDIEGAEREALAGAAGTIVRDRPDLAVSVYHRIDDLWTILLQIDALGVGHRFHLRSHAHNGFDTVLYAVAPR